MCSVILLTAISSGRRVKIELEMLAAPRTMRPVRGERRLPGVLSPAQALSIKTLST